MKSTGEVMGGATDFGHAFAKAMLGAGQRLPEQGTVCLSVNNDDKAEVVAIGKAMAEMGFAIVGTRGTAVYLRAHGVDCGVVFKVNEGRPNLADEIVNRCIHLVVNTPLGLESFFDDTAVRRAAMIAGIPCITTMTGAAAAVDAIRALKGRDLDVRSLQEYHLAAAPVS
jgi:carbamoyl-phosphate synthase large subunit